MTAPLGARAYAMSWHVYRGASSASQRRQTDPNCDACAKSERRLSGGHANRLFYHRRKQWQLKKTVNSALAAAGRTSQVHGFRFRGSADPDCGGERGDYTDALSIDRSDQQNWTSDMEQYMPPAAIGEVMRGGGIGGGGGLELRALGGRRPRWRFARLARLLSRP